MLDDRDRKILSILQSDADVPMAEIASMVALSPSACSRRIARLRDAGYIRATVAVLDRGKLNAPTTIFVLVRTGAHTEAWLRRFQAAIGEISEIVEAHRLTGNFDYIMKIALPNVEHYDYVYKRILSKVELFEMSAYISMETVKEPTGTPTQFAR